MKREKLVIGLDIDGVILDNTESKIKFAKELGWDLKPEQTPADVIKKILPPDILNKLRQFLYGNRRTALLAELMPGVHEGLGAIQKSGHQFCLISRRKNPEITIELLRHHGLWGNYFTNGNIFFVLTKKEKDKKAAELGLDLYIDDQPSVLAELNSVRQKVLFDRFGCFPESGFKTVNSWPQFLELLGL